MEVLKRCRYALLAGTMLAAFALPQLSAALDGTIVVAQKVDPNDPNQKKDKDKGKPPAKKEQPKEVPKGAGQPQQPALKPNEPPKTFSKPVDPGQPKQFGKPPTETGQQQQQQQQKQFEQKKFEQQKQFGKPSGDPGQPKQFGKPTDTGQQQQQKQFEQKKFEQQKQFGKPSGDPGQQKQFGKPVDTGQQQQQQKQFEQKKFEQQKQFGKPTPAQQNLPAAAGMQGIANVDDLKSKRRERTEAGGAKVIEEPGNRQIVRQGNHTFIRNDDGDRFRRFAPNAQVSKRGAETFTVYDRPGGFQIINITDSNGRLLRRVRRGPDGREYVLIENRRGAGFGTGVAVGLVAGVAAGVFLNLPPPAVNIPRDRYIVDAYDAPPDLLYETLDAPPLVPIERAYSLDEVRYNVELRDRVRRVDVNTINFSSGSWEVTPDQYDRLAAIGQAMQRVLERNPNAIFMIEGYTDAVGSDDDNLSLSDRRAESVAVILSQQFQISPENMVTQGYGEQYLKVQTEGPSRENRRTAVRNVTGLLDGQQAAR
jgi:outer membrane protein OmpA-like peptidoglycan-associated protein